MCIWKKSEAFDFEELYYTSCDNSFFFSEGNIKENHFKFCPFCGKKIKEE